VSTPPPITDQGRFEALVDQLASEQAVALDTEFHRERTYFPRIALLQLAWGDEVALVDPLRVDLHPLARVLDSDVVIVIHAASQDLEVLLRSSGAVPRHLFDTQIAAGFLGMSAPSLAALVEREIGAKLPKGDRLTDWLARPLTEAQLAYAAADVAHLLEIWRRQCEQLTARGRLGWAEAEFAELRSRARISRPPDEAWTRIKEVRQLKGQARQIAQEVAAWREERAIEIDQPSRFVMADLAVVAVAQRAPRTPEELRSIRGVDDRHARGETAKAILEAVQRGLDRKVERPPRATNGELSRELRPAVGLVSSTPRCSPPARTSNRSCGATRRRGSPPAGAPSWSASRSVGWSPGRPRSRSTRTAAWCSRTAPASRSRSTATTDPLERAHRGSPDDEEQRGRGAGESSVTAPDPADEQPDDPGDGGGDEGGEERERADPAHAAGSEQAHHRGGERDAHGGAEGGDEPPLTPDQGVRRGARDVHRAATSTTEITTSARERILRTVVGARRSCTLAPTKPPTMAPTPAAETRWASTRP
jgi:ribonuclease D